ncbi:hypothetical protein ACIBCM_27040 [Streptomyces sp. NPDC051018]|uniref:hypothetical protein n=1 Tax=Streptomyces sp. NPDC051018 TaxID=3365639 RepID=UPI00378E1D75
MLLTMDQGVAALIAGLAGTIGALGGGLIAGTAAIRGARTAGEAVRQQVRDQAVVEHRQWLRGQRQQAYAGAVRAVEAFIAAAESAMFCGDDDRPQHMARVVETHENFQATAVMINLVGPQEVHATLYDCSAATNHFRNALHDWAADHTDDQERVTAVIERARALAPARSALVDALQGVLARASPFSGATGDRG